MPIGSADLLQGSRQILRLKALLAEGTHGYGVARWIEQATGDVLRVEEGSRYPGLRRLEDKGYVSVEALRAE
jgi:DNA-binding PadR family transcriptional regulator